MDSSNKISEFENKLDNHNKDFSSKNQPLDNEIFHYTSYNGLKGILTSQRLWQTDFYTLNDPSELHYGFEVLKKIFEEKYANRKNYFEYSKFVDCLEKTLKQGLKGFISSFCEEGDHLPNWRYYGDNGAGYSIGFKREYFTSTSDHVGENSRIFHKIFYPNIENLSDKDPLNVEGFLQEFFNIADNYNQDWYKNEKYISSLISRLLPYVLFLKNPDYHDEKEYRTALVKIITPDKKKIYPAKFPHERVLIHPSKQDEDTPPFLKKTEGTIVRVESDQFCYSDIKKIIIGPRLDFIAAKLGIENILRENGADECTIKDIEIVDSEKSYQ